MASESSAIKCPADVGQEWIESEKAEVRGDLPDLTEWWRVFGDPDLDSLVWQAAEQNLPLQAAGLRVIQARALRGIAAGEFFPQLQQARGSYARVANSENLSVGGTLTPDSDWNLFEVGFDTSWELDVWGRFRRNIESADANLQASVAAYDDILVTLIGDVAATYIDIRTFQRRIELANANVALQENTLRIATARFRNGLVTELDVTQAKANLANTQALVPGLETGLRRAEVQLAILLGQPPDNARQLLIQPRGIPMAPSEVVAGIPVQLLRRRPDIRNAERLAAAQSARIGVAVTDMLPHVFLTGSIGYEANSFEDLFLSGSLAGRGVPGFRWDILNYGRIINNVRLQDALYEEAVVSYQDTVIRAVGEVETALAEFLNGRTGAERLAESVAATRRSTELALTQYREGLVGFIRVLDTQQFLVEQEDQLASTQSAVARGLVAAYKALGGGWEIHQGCEFVSEPVARRMAERTNWGDILSGPYAPGRDLCFPRPQCESDSGPLDAVSEARPTEVAED